MADALTARIQLQGADEIKRLFADLADAGKQAFASLNEGAKRLGEIGIPLEKAKEDLAGLVKLGKDTFAEISAAAKRVDVAVPVEKVKRAITEAADPSAFAALAEAARNSFIIIGEGALGAGLQVKDLEKAVKALFKASPIGTSIVSGAFVGGAALNKLSDQLVEFSDASIAEKLEGRIKDTEDLEEAVKNLGKATRQAVRDFQDEDGALTDLERELVLAQRAFKEMIGELGTVGPKVLTPLGEVRAALRGFGVDTDIISKAFTDLRRGIEAEWDRIRVATQAGNAQLIKDALQLQQLQRAQAQSGLSVEAAQLSLAQARARLNIVKGGAVDPQQQKRLEQEQAILAVEEAELRVQQAIIAQQQAAENVAAARRKAAEDAANSLPNTIKLVNNLIAGVNVIGPKVNETAENLAKGFAASIPESERANLKIRELTGTVSDLNRNAPRLGPIFNRLADLFKATGDSALNARIANILFGRSIDENLLKALSSGSQGLAQARDLAKSIEGLKEQFSTRNLENFGAQLLRIKDPTERLNKATEVLGETFGKLFADGLDKSGSAKETAAVFDETAKKFSANIRTANNFKEAVDKLKESLLGAGAASKNKALDLGLLIAPAATPVINAIAEGIKGLKLNLGEFASTIGSSVTPVIKDFFRLLSGTGDAEIRTEWLVTLRDGIVAFGKGVQQVFENVIKPAFEGLKELAGGIAASLNEAFGTGVSGTFVALTIGLAALTSGWKALAVGVLAAVGAIKSANIDFGALFKGFGIDISGALGSIREFGGALKTALLSGDFSEIEASFKSLPGIIVLVIGSLFALHKGAALLGPTLARLFGLKQVTGGAVTFLAAIGQISGILPTLTTILGGAAAASLILLNAIKALAIIFATPIALVAALALLVTNMETAKDIADGLATAINAIFGTNLTGGEVLLTAIGSIVAALIVLRGAAIATATTLATTLLTAVRVVAPAVIAIASLLAILERQRHSEALDGVIEKLKKLDEEFKDGDKASEAYQKRLAELQKEFDRLGGNAPSTLDRIRDGLRNLLGITTDVGNANKTAATSTETAWGSAIESIKQKFQSLIGASKDSAKQISADNKTVSREALADRGLTDKPIVTPAQLEAMREAARMKIITRDSPQIPGVITSATPPREGILTNPNAKTAVADLVAQAKAAQEAADKLKLADDAVKDIGTKADQAASPLQAMKDLAIDIGDALGQLPQLVAPPFTALVQSAEAAATSVVAEMRKIAESAQQAFEAVGKTRQSSGSNVEQQRAGPNIDQQRSGLNVEQQRAGLNQIQTGLDAIIDKTKQATDLLNKLPAGGASPIQRQLDQLQAPAAPTSGGFAEFIKNLLTLLSSPAKAAEGPIQQIGAAAQQAVAPVQQFSDALDKASRTGGKMTALATDVQTGANSIKQSLGGIGPLFDFAKEGDAAHASKVFADLLAELSGFADRLQQLKTAGADSDLLRNFIPDKTLDDLLQRIRLAFKLLPSELQPAQQEAVDRIRDNLAKEFTRFNELRLNLPKPTLGTDLGDELETEGITGPVAKLRENIRGLATDAGQVAGPLQQIGAAAQQVATPIQRINQAFESIRQTGQAVLLDLQNGFTQLPTTIAPGFQSLVQSAQIAAAAVVAEIDKIIAKAKEAAAALAANPAGQLPPLPGLQPQFQPLPRAQPGPVPGAQPGAIAPTLDSAGVLQSARTAAEQLVAVFTEAGTRIGQALTQSLTNAGASLQTLATQIGQSFATAFTDSLTSIRPLFDGLGTQIQTLVQAALTQLQSLIAKAQEAAAAIAKTSPSGGGSSAPAFAGGGVIRGPGTGTSDSILAWLSDGEGVLTARALRHYGSGIVSMINALRLPRLQGFSLGGIADRLNRSLAIPSFATGGLANAAFAAAAAAPGGTPLNFHFPGLGSVTNLIAADPQDAVRQMSRIAARAQRTRTGKQPSWKT